MSTPWVFSEKNNLLKLGPYVMILDEKCIVDQSSDINTIDYQKQDAVKPIRI